MKEETHDAAAHHAKNQDGVAVAHAAGVFSRGDIKALMKPALDVPILSNQAEQFVGALGLHRQAAHVIHRLTGVLALVFATQESHLAGDLDDRACPDAAERLRRGAHPAQSALFMSGAVVEFFFFGGNAQRDGQG